MTDTFDFEAAFERRLRAHAEVATRPFDASTVAHQAVGRAGRPVMGRLHLPAILSRRQAFVAVVVLALVLAMLGAVVVGASLLREPDRPLGALAVGYPNGLVLARADGSDPRWIRTDGPYFSPRWSADGAYLAAATVSDADANILRVLRSDGSVVVDIPRVFDYRWSPVRDEIAISVVGPFDGSLAAPHIVRPPTAREHAIAIVGMPGTQRPEGAVGGDGLSRLIVERLEATTSARTPFDPARSLAWGSDGRRLFWAFVYPDDRSPGVAIEGGSGGSGFDRLPGEVMSAAFAPVKDGLALVVRKCEETGSGQPPCSNRLYATTSTRPETFTISGLSSVLAAVDDGTTPSWSGDGRQILFALYGDIYFVDADDGGVTLLTTDPATESLAAWSPEGDRILFSRQRLVGGPTGSALDFWAMDPDGSHQSLLASNAIGAEWQPTR